MIWKKNILTVILERQVETVQIFQIVICLMFYFALVTVKKLFVN